MSSTKKLQVVFGASDPESTLARTLCVGDVTAHTALCGRKPVHPGNAYRADAIDPPIDPSVPVVRFECGGPVFDGCTDVTVCDHHFPGDPGYGRPPEEFLAASSIGQMVAVLAKLNLVPRPSEPRHNGRVGWATTFPKNEYDYAGSFTYEPTYGDCSHYCVAMLPCDCDDSTQQCGCRIPADIVLAAAADHCLEAAYRGRCQGVDPDALMKWRAESRAAFQGRSLESVMADIEAARKRLREAVQQCLPVSVWGHDDDGNNYPSSIPAEYADLRGEHIPELPEAAAREGIPFISDQTDRDGRKKVVLMAAPPELVKRFMSGQIVPGLVDVYGDPSRGFSGGYTA